VDGFYIGGLHDAPGFARRFEIVETVLGDLDYRPAMIGGIGTLVDLAHGMYRGVE
jgi:hypothetical protein